MRKVAARRSSLTALVCAITVFVGACTGGGNGGQNAARLATEDPCDVFRTSELPSLLNVAPDLASTVMQDTAGVPAAPFGEISGMKYCVAFPGEGRIVQWTGLASGLASEGFDKYTREVRGTLVKGVGDKAYFVATTPKDARPEFSLGAGLLVLQGNKLLGLVTNVAGDDRPRERLERLAKLALGAR